MHKITVTTKTGRLIIITPDWKETIRKYYGLGVVILKERVR